MSACCTAVEFVGVSAAAAEGIVSLLTTTIFLIEDCVIVSMIAERASKVRIRTSVTRLRFFTD